MAGDTKHRFASRFIAVFLFKGSPPLGCAPVPHRTGTEPGAKDEGSDIPTEKGGFRICFMITRQIESRSNHDVLSKVDPPRFDMTESMPLLLYFVA